MIQEENYSIELQRPFPHVKRVMLAFSKTFVIISYSEKRMSTILLHVDISGRVLNRYCFIRCFAQNEIMMINEMCVAIFDKHDCKLIVINLKTRELKSIQYKPFSHNSKIQFNFFKQTQLFVLVEVDPIDRLGITYLCQDGSEIVRYITQKGEFKKDYLVEMGDHNSMILWSNRDHVCTISVWAYDLRFQQPRYIEIDLTPLELSRVTLLSILECSKDCFYICCNTNRFSENPKYEKREYFLYNIRTCVISNSVIEHMIPQNSHFSRPFNLGFYSYFQAGPCQVKNNWKYLFVVDSRQDQVMITIELKGENQLLFQKVRYEDDCFLVAQIFEQKSIKIKLYALGARTKQKYFHLMLNINKDFDEDLLQEALQLLSD